MADRDRVLSSKSSSSSSVLSDFSSGSSPFSTLSASFCFASSSRRFFSSSSALACWASSFAFSIRWDSGIEPALGSSNVLPKVASRSIHRVAARLDALRDGDFAFAGQQLDRPHFAQVHAHGVVGAVDDFSGTGGGGDLARGGFVGLVTLRCILLGPVIIDDVDAHFR